MKVVVSNTGNHSNLYSYTWAVAAGVGTLTISGVQGFDLTQAALDTIYDTTLSAFINCKRVTVSYNYLAGLPVWVYTLPYIPTAAQSTDALVVTLDIPQIYAAIALQQYQASRI